MTEDETGPGILPREALDLLCIYPYGYKGTRYEVKRGTPLHDFLWDHPEYEEYFTIINADAS